MAKAVELGRFSQRDKFVFVPVVHAGDYSIDEISSRFIGLAKILPMGRILRDGRALALLV